MKLQILNITPHDKVSANKGFCTQVCRERDEVLRYINRALESGQEPVDGEVMCCPLDGEGCKVEIDFNY